MNALSHKFDFTPHYPILTSIAICALYTFAAWIVAASIRRFWIAVYPSSSNQAGPTVSLVILPAFGLTSLATLTFIAFLVFPLPWTKSVGTAFNLISTFLLLWRSKNIANEAFAESKKPLVPDPLRRRPMDGWVDQFKPRPYDSEQNH